MKHLHLNSVLVILLLWCSGLVTVEDVYLTFHVPDPSGTTAPRSVNENSPKDVSILTVEAGDSDGDTLTFSINSQSPASPPFLLDGSSGLFKTPLGINAEVSTKYTFTFSVTDGTTTVDSHAFIVNINDIDEFGPVFQNEPYSTSFINNVTNGYAVFTVTATDADATSNTVTYSITGGNSPTRFAIANTGVITVSDKTQLTVTTYTLTIQALSNTKIASENVVITVIEDICGQTPCANSGTCAQTGNNYTCTCTAQYFGQNCTQENFCNGDPCLNGGTCVNGDTNYTCTCAAGFLGRNCSTVDYCHPTDPCQNGGTCVTEATKYSCNCAGGYLGQNCSQVDFCYPDNPCQYGGTCVSMATKYSCTCAAGYIGQNCSQETGTDKPDSDGPGTGVIVGSVIGVIVGILLIIAAVAGYLYKTGKLKKRETQPEEVDLKVRNNSGSSMEDDKQHVTSDSSTAKLVHEHDKNINDKINTNLGPDENVDEKILTSETAESEIEKEDDETLDMIEINVKPDSRPTSNTQM